jgi:hypothetical protein
MKVLSTFDVRSNNKGKTSNSRLANGHTHPFQIPKLIAKVAVKQNKRLVPKGLTIIIILIKVCVSFMGYD